MKLPSGANKALAGNAGSLLGSTAITSVLGFVYWWLAARKFEPAEVGLATSCISAMALIATLCAAGTGSFLIGELARHRHSRLLLAGATALAGGLAALAGLAFALVAPLAASDLAILHQPVVAGLYGLGCAIMTVGLVLDQASIGLLSGHVQLARNAVWAVLKLGLLLALALVPAWRLGFGIYLTWVAGCAVSLFVFLPLLLRRSTISPTDKGGAPSARRGRAFLAHNAGNLALQAPGLCLPLLVTVFLSATLTAYFYMAWMIAGVLFVLPVSLATSFFSVAAREPDALGARLRFSLTASFAGGLAAVAVLALGGRLLLGFFGADYAREAALVLSILSLAVFPMAIKHHYFALARVRGGLRRATIVLGVSGLLDIAFSAAGARWGVTGLSAGWLLANLVQASIMLPAIVHALGWRRWRTAHSGPLARGEPAVSTSS